MSTAPTPPAFSGSRLGWGDLPRDLRTRIQRLAGAEVVSESTATNGFSPGFASTLELGDGTCVFVKAVAPDLNPLSPTLARAEVHVNRLLPPEASAPELLFADDDGTWVALGFAVVDGAAPTVPWEDAELTLALEAVARLTRVPAPSGLRDLREMTGDLFTGWGRLAQDRVDLDAVLEALPEHAAWLPAALPRLRRWEEDGVGATAGDRLVHADLRGDNMLVGTGTGGRRVWLVDWPHASAGSPVFDVVGMLPSVAMSGGGAAADVFARHPGAEGMDPRDVRDVLAGIAGYLVRSAVQAPPRGIPNLRAFQLAQGRAALDWLRVLDA
ncbi:aminoglycoside phosphotransferase [Actinotalea ferrariae CF5-4]|uniref:Aminoglycoside phosphotransferase n=1 Tax=Actinotalea ferrariae CF5-4 TaxID=948458 RepID=A0A021VUN3_9CELL|nr:aminoglycoside phosphotransferase family protein [Actinotalea ferrariae]EYR63770.1 aminoglycoside phosphotransferase [Actinotalea ferrariae CF5-4]